MEPSHPLPSDEFLDSAEEQSTQDGESSAIHRLNTSGSHPRFVPNEFVGYKIIPDGYQWTVAIVRKRGPSHKQAGSLYFTPIGYFKTLTQAASEIVERDARQRGDMDDLKFSFREARDHAVQAVKDLEALLLSRGFNFERHKI